MICFAVTLLQAIHPLVLLDIWTKRAKLGSFLTNSNSDTTFLHYSTHLFSIIYFVYNTCVKAPQI